MSKLEAPSRTSMRGDLTDVDIGRKVFSLSGLRLLMPSTFAPLCSRQAFSSARAELFRRWHRLRRTGCSHRCRRGTGCSRRSCDHEPF